MPARLKNHGFRYALVICGLLLLCGAFLAYALPVRAADPCTTPGVTCVTSAINANTTWSSGIYYLKSDIHVSPGNTLTIAGGVILKFDYPYSPTSPNANPYGLFVDKGANLVFQNTNSSDKRVLFTSGRDDSPEAGGDTNGDGVQTLPGNGDWEGLVLPDWTSSTPFENLTFRYSRDGINIQSATLAIPSTVQIQNNGFYQSTCGLTVSVPSSYNNQVSIHNNGFYGNKYGLCTSVTGSGQAMPLIQTNTFDGNLVLPIYLNGTSYPSYSGNTFVGTADVSDPNNKTDHLGVGLGGVWRGSGTWEVINGMPFVVVANVDIYSGASISVSAGSAIKFFTKYDLPMTNPPNLPPGTKISVYGTFNLGSTALNPIIFSSYRDDSVAGDTNGDGAISVPMAGDWDSLYYRDSAATGAANLTIQYLNVRYGTNGILYESTDGNAVRQPTFRQITFDGNLNGLRLKAVSNSAGSRLVPTIDTCTFINQGIIPLDKNQLEPGVPVFLENTVQPSFLNNTFTNNLHPAIGITGVWRSDANWQGLPGNGLNPMPYLVHGDTRFGNTDSNIHDDSATLTIPAGSVIKFNVNQYERNYKSRLTVAGILNMGGTSGQKVVFTSYYDSTYGGSTSSEAVTPAEQDWGDVIIRNRQSVINYAIFRYGDKALHLQSNENDLAYVLNQAITNSRFENNEFGVYLDIEQSSNITPLIENDVFSGNSYGLGTYARSSFSSPPNPRTNGMSIPTIRLSTFETSSQFPIYLNGSATLAYLQPSTVFQNNVHRAIALGGYFGSTSETMVFPRIAGDSNAPFGGKTFPYVVLNNTTFDWLTTARVDGGLVFKFADNAELRYYGRLNLDTALASPNYYTSYRDDYYDDTNGTPNPNPAPARGVWRGIYIYHPQTASFSYSTIKWSEQGLVIFQDRYSLGNLQPVIEANTFTENKNGLTSWIGSSFDNLSLVKGNTFYSNDFGLHTYTDPNNSYAHNGTSDLLLTNNNFQAHSEFPIYLQGSSNPTYSGNTLWDNTHPAIAVGGVWSRNATWTHVFDNTFNQIMPYVVREDVIQEYYGYVPKITIPADTYVKVMDGKYIYAWSIINLPTDSVVAGHEVVFTSYRDDAYGGDINRDGATVPPRNSWKTFWIIDFPGKINDIHNVIVRYATAGLGVYYDGPENTQSTTTIRQATMQYNASCIALVIGWYQESQNIVHPGAGNIQTTLQDIQMKDSDYGLLTIAMDKSTGIIQPTLTNIQFSNITRYPIYLGGTSYPNFTGLNTITSTTGFSPEQSSAAGETAAPLEEVSLGGMDLPANAAALASIKPGAPSQSAVVQSGSASALSAAPDLAPAIGLAGVWNNSGTLMNIPGIPYALTGRFPLTVTVYGVNYTPSDDVTIGMTSPAFSTATVTVPQGTVFKLDTSRKIIVKGALSLQSTPSQPVIFTSLKDDAAGGDTNKDGSLSKPASGDWGEIQLVYGSPDFHNAVVRYATNGLHLYFDGAVNSNLLGTVRESIFTNNSYGILLTAKKMGNIVANITQNLFKSNGTHIYGEPSDAGNSGQLCIKASQNDLLGSSTQNGITNLNLNGVTPSDPCTLTSFDARNNFWGDGSGPTHPGNPGGKGTIVSDRVQYNPWLGGSVFPPVTYSILGRVTQDTSQGAGLSGVTVTLLGASNATVLTDQNGYYSFENLDNGSYMVYPSLSGYLFAPSSVNVTIDGVNAPDINFVGTISPANVAISVLPYSVLRPITTASTVSCKFNVILDKPLAAGKSAKVDFYTADGTATKGQDYNYRSGTLTFLANGPTTQQVSVDLIVGKASDPEEFFSLILTNPVEATLTNSVAACTIQSRANLRYYYLPSVRK